MRRYILIPIILWFLFAGCAAFALSYALGYYKLLSAPWNSAAGTLLFFTIVISVFIIKIYLPLRKITREIKAMLTGGEYKKIMTDKKNELGLLAHFFNEITRNLENISRGYKSQQRIQKELNVAQEIQKDLLPKAMPNSPGLEIAAETRSASEIGGDTYDFAVQEKRSLIYIGDSTGHGIPAGIVMVMVDVLLETFFRLYNAPLEIMVNLNKHLKPHLKPTVFMTMILLAWDHEKFEMKWVGAGHEYLIHVNSAKNTVKSIPAGGIAIGMVEDSSKILKEQTLGLQTNDFLILYSDGITEAKNITGEIYGLTRLETAVKEHATPDINSKDLFDHIVRDVSRFAEGATQEDDMTLIVIKHVPKI